MLKSADKNCKFCQIFRKNFVCSRTLRNLSVELVFYHFVNHILTNSTDFLTINSNYRPVCDGLKPYFCCITKYIRHLHILNGLYLKKQK